eukprot:UN24298
METLLECKIKKLSFNCDVCAYSTKLKYIAAAKNHVIDILRINNRNELEFLGKIVQLEKQGFDGVKYLPIIQDLVFVGDLICAVSTYNIGMSVIVWKIIPRAAFNGKDEKGFLHQQIYSTKMSFTRESLQDLDKTTQCNVKSMSSKIVVSSNRLSKLILIDLKTKKDKRYN